jgi:formylglycine-generating enzyme
MARRATPSISGWLALTTVSGLVSACALVMDYDNYSLDEHSNNGGEAGSGGEAGRGGSGGNSGQSGSGAMSGNGGSGGPGGSGGTAGSAGTGGTAGTAGTAGTGAAGGAGGAGGTGGGCLNCGSLEQCFNDLFCVAKEVPIPGGYSIDSTEVTRSQYVAWLATNPPGADQLPECSWNTSFGPDSACMAFLDVCQNSCGRHPQVCVDWCDAYAYCKGVGKRLCGKIGGGANNSSDFSDATKSQWHNACSSNGQNAYTYGNDFDGKACNGGAQEVLTTLPVGSLTGCQSSLSGYAGVYDLSGNVREWEDSCDSTIGSSDMCRTRGGFFRGITDELHCDDPVGDIRGRSGERIRYVGFRCCSP